MCKWQSKPKFSKHICDYCVRAPVEGSPAQARLAWRAECTWVLPAALTGTCGDFSSAVVSVFSNGGRFFVAAEGIGCLIKIGLVEWSHLPVTIIPSAAVDIWLSASHPGILGIRKPWWDILELIWRGCREKKCISSNVVLFFGFFFLPKVYKLQT